MWMKFAQYLCFCLAIVKGQSTPSGCVYTEEGGHSLDNINQPTVKMNWDDKSATIEVDLDQQYFKECFIPIVNNDYINYAIYKKDGDSMVQVITEAACQNSQDQLISGCDYASSTNKLKFEVKIPETKVSEYASYSFKVIVYMAKIGDEYNIRQQATTFHVRISGQLQIRSDIRSEGSESDGMFIAGTEPKVQKFYNSKITFQDPINQENSLAFTSLDGTFCDGGQQTYQILQVKDMLTQIAVSTDAFQLQAINTGGEKFMMTMSPQKESLAEGPYEISIQETCVKNDDKSRSWAARYSYELRFYHANNWNFCKANFYDIQYDSNVLNYKLWEDKGIVTQIIYKFRTRLKIYYTLEGSSQTDFKYEVMDRETRIRKCGRYSIGFGTNPQQSVVKIPPTFSFEDQQNIPLLKLRDKTEKFELKLVNFDELQLTMGTKNSYNTGMYFFNVFSIEYNDYKFLGGTEIFKHYSNANGLQLFRIINICDQDQINLINDKNQDYALKETNPKKEIIYDKTKTADDFVFEETFTVISNQKTGEPDGVYSENCGILKLDPNYEIISGSRYQREKKDSYELHLQDIFDNLLVSYSLETNKLTVKSSLKEKYQSKYYIEIRFYLEKSQISKYVTFELNIINECNRLSQAYFSLKTSKADSFPSEYDYIMKQEQPITRKAQLSSALRGSSLITDISQLQTKCGTITYSYTFELSKWDQKSIVINFGENIPDQYQKLALEDCFQITQLDSLYDFNVTINCSKNYMELINQSFQREYNFLAVLFKMLLPEYPKFTHYSVAYFKVFNVCTAKLEDNLIHVPSGVQHKIEYFITYENKEWEQFILMDPGVFYNVDDQLYPHNKLRIFADCGPLKFDIVTIDKVTDSPVIDQYLNKFTLQEKNTTTQQFPKIKIENLESNDDNTLVKILSNEWQDKGEYEITFAARYANYPGGKANAFQRFLLSIKDLCYEKTIMDELVDLDLRENMLFVAGYVNTPLELSMPYFKSLTNEQLVKNCGGWSQVKVDYLENGLLKQDGTKADQMIYEGLQISKVSDLNFQLNFNVNDRSMNGIFKLKVKKMMTNINTKFTIQEITLDIKDKCYITEPIVTIKEKVYMSKEILSMKPVEYTFQRLKDVVGESDGSCGLVTIEIAGMKKMEVSPGTTKQGIELYQQCRNKQAECSLLWKDLLSYNYSSQQVVLKTDNSDFIGKYELELKAIFKENLSLKTAQVPPLIIEILPCKVSSLIPSNKMNHLDLLKEKFISIRGGTYSKEMRAYVYEIKTSNLVIQWNKFEEVPAKCGYNQTSDIQIKKSSQANFTSNRPPAFQIDSNNQIRVQTQTRRDVGLYNIQVNTVLKDLNNTVMRDSLLFDIYIDPGIEKKPFFLISPPREVNLKVKEHHEIILGKYFYNSEEQDTCSIEINDGTNFTHIINSVEKGPILIIEPKNNYDVGIFNLTIILKESETGLSNEYQIGVVVEQENPNSFNTSVFIPTFDVEEQKMESNETYLQVVPDDYEPVQLKVKKISRNGILRIEFNQELKIPQNVLGQKRFLGQEKIENIIGVQIDSQTSEAPPIYKIVIVEWTKLFLDILIDFENPQALSMNGQRDKISVKIKDFSFFISEKSGKALEKQPEQNMKVSIPKQLPKGVSEEVIVAQAVATSSTVTAVFIIQIAAALLLKGSVNKLFALVAALQIIIYFPLYTVDYPALVEIFIEALQKIAEFDFFNSQDIILWMGYQVDDDAQEGKESAGFPSKDLILNYSLYIMIVVLCILALLVAGLVAIVKKYRPKIQYIVKKKIKQFRWNGLIRSLMFSYLRSCVNFGLAVQILTFKSFGEKLKSAIVIANGVYLFGFPIWTGWLLQRHKDNLEKRQMKKYYETLYIGLRTKEEGTLLYPMIYMWRRQVFVMIAFVFSYFTYFQIQTIIFSSQLYNIYLGYYRVHKNKRDYYLEMLNETTIILLSYHLILFTQFNLNDDLRFPVAISFVVCIAIMIIANIIAMAGEVYNQVKQARQHKLIENYLWKMRQIQLEREEVAKEKAKLKKQQEEEEFKRYKRLMCPKPEEYEEVMKERMEIRLAEERQIQEMIRGWAEKYAAQEVEQKPSKREIHLQKQREKYNAERSQNKILTEYEKTCKLIEEEKENLLTLVRARGILKSRKQKVVAVAKFSLTPSFDIVAEQPDEEEVNEEEQIPRKSSEQSFGENKEITKKKVKFISEPSECGKSESDQELGINQEQLDYFINDLLKEDRYKDNDSEISFE